MLLSQLVQQGLYLLDIIDRSNPLEFCNPVFVEKGIFSKELLCILFYIFFQQIKEMFCAFRQRECDITGGDQLAFRQWLFGFQDGEPG